MDELINVLKNNPDGAYDFICNNYFRMNKYELSDIIKELLYAIHTNMDKVEHNKILGDVADELEESYAE